MTGDRWTRRDVLLTGAALGSMPLTGLADERRMIARPVPSSDEMVPVIGLGTYSVFDVDSTPGQIASRREIVDLLLGAGGSFVDTSPMYNR